MQWNVGFADRTEPQHLLRHRFPSKLGGRPVSESETESSTGVRCECRGCTGGCDSWDGVVSVSVPA